MRRAVDISISTVAIDPIRNPVTGDVSYGTTENDTVINLSRRGLCIRSTHPPGVGDRVLLTLQLPGQTEAVEVIGRTRWTRVNRRTTRGNNGAAFATAGIELIGGSSGAFDRYDRSLAKLV